MSTEATYKAYTRLYTRLLDDTRKINELGIGRFALLGLELEQQPKLVVHGDSEMVKGIAQSNLRDLVRITQIESKSVTLPLIDATKIQQSTDELAIQRGMTDLLAAELRPRKKLFYNMPAPLFWEQGVSYKSMYSEEVKPHVGKILSNYIQYSMERWEAIEGGGDTAKWDQSIQTSKTAESQLSLKQREDKKQREEKRLAMGREGDEEGEREEHGMTGGVNEGLEDGGKGRQEETVEEGAEGQQRDREEQGIERVQSRRPVPRGYRPVPKEIVEQLCSVPAASAASQPPLRTATHQSKASTPLTVVPPCAKRFKESEKRVEKENVEKKEKVVRRDDKVEVQEESRQRGGLFEKGANIRVAISVDGRMTCFAICGRETTVEGLLRQKGIPSEGVRAFAGNSRLALNRILRCAPSVMEMERSGMEVEIHVHSENYLPLY